MSSLPPLPPSTSPLTLPEIKLTTRIVEAPRNALEYVWISLPTSVEDILPPTRWAAPLGMALFLLQWVLLAPVVKPRDEMSMWRDGPEGNRVDARWHRYEDEWRQQQARRGILGTSSVS